MLRIREKKKHIRKYIHNSLRFSDTSGLCPGVVHLKKWERELGAGMDHVILSLYARGPSVEDVRHQLRELCGLEVSVETISAVTDRVLEEVVTWKQRPLAVCYAMVYLDAIHFNPT